MRRRTDLRGDSDRGSDGQTDGGRELAAGGGSVTVSPGHIGVVDKTYREWIVRGEFY